MGLYGILFNGLPTRLIVSIVVQMRTSSPEIPIHKTRTAKSKAKNNHLAAATVPPLVNQGHHSCYQASQPMVEILSKYLCLILL